MSWKWVYSSPFTPSLVKPVLTRRFSQFSVVGSSAGLTFKSCDSGVVRLQSSCIYTSKKKSRVKIYLVEQIMNWPRSLFPAIIEDRAGQLNIQLGRTADGSGIFSSLCKTFFFSFWLWQVLNEWKIMEKTVLCMCATYGILVKASSRSLFVCHVCTDFQHESPSRSQTPKPVGVGEWSTCTGWLFFYFGEWFGLGTDFMLSWTSVVTDRMYDLAKQQFLLYSNSCMV